MIPHRRRSITRRLIDRAAEDVQQEERARDTLRRLSERGHEVALAIAAGQSNAEPTPPFGRPRPARSLPACT